MSTSPIIQLSSISKKFAGKSILKNICFQVRPGTFCALLGENGAGKSTILNILMGHEIPDLGHGRMLGQDIARDSFEQRNFIGHVTEKINYDFPISVEAFFKQYAKFYENRDQQVFERLMKEQNLDLQSCFLNFSRGQKMQTALIAALAIRPKILLIDEITSVLDIYARKYFMDQLKKFTREGGTVLITTNIISEIQFFADKLVLIHEGVVALESEIKDIHAQFTKIRKLPGHEHLIFDHQECYWVAENSDGSSSYIVPTQLAEEMDVETSMIDRRSVTLDEVFIYVIKIGIKKDAGPI